jgi:preprotein translocase subunit SecE
MAMTSVKDEVKKSIEQESSWSKMAWLLIAVLVVGGLFANFHYQQVDWAIRLAIGIVLSCGVLVLGLQTAFGRVIKSFVKDARNEMRKVVWPDRQTTVRSTMTVMVVVVISALMLWGIDAILAKCVKLLTN